MQDAELQSTLPLCHLPPVFEEDDRLMNEQEAAWIEAARKGDKSAFSRLVEAYQRPVYNLTFRMLGNAEEAQDAAQETFLRAYSRLGQYDPTHKFSTWIFSIANHFCIDRLRRRRTTQVSIDDNPVLQNLEDDDPLPEEGAMDQEQRATIQSLLNQLEPEYRTPLVLLYWEDCSYEEIATSMGLTVSAVKSRLFRARQKMADLIKMQQTVKTPPSPGKHRMAVPPTRTPVGLESMLNFFMRPQAAAGLA